MGSREETVREWSEGDRREGSEMGERGEGLRGGIGDVRERGGTDGGGSGRVIWEKEVNEC